MKRRRPTPAPALAAPLLAAAALAVFIGAGGRELARTEANPAVYELRENVGYVRARVTDSGGAQAWTQPVFVTLKK